MKPDDETDRALEERQDDAVRACREAEILVKIADIEKAAILAQLAAVRSESDRFEVLRREHDEVKRDLSDRLDAANRRMRRLASVAAKQVGRAFTAGAFDGGWPLRGWLLRRRAKKLRQSGLVDATWYLARNADVAESGMDPVLHYLHHGAEEGRAPNPALEDPPEDESLAK